MSHTPSVLDLIGNTPLVHVNHLPTGPCDLFLKLESQNPTGSIKDRIAAGLIEAAERDGKLVAGGTLVEATAGNTGLALALVAAQKGYRLILVIPDKMSQEKIYHLKALGAEIILTRSDVERGHPEHYQEKARRIADHTKGAYFVNQFSNPANPIAHEKRTAPEIWEQMDRKVDAIICGVGSGGTLTGLGRFFSRVAPRAEIILADPKGSVLASMATHGVAAAAGSWLVEGIGQDYVPQNCDLSFVKKVYTVADSESIATAREVLSKEGILCGSSSGTLIAAALRYCREQTEPKRVVTFVCDSGSKYLSKIFNPYWLDDHDLISQPLTQDLRDLIARPYLQGEVICASPHETLKQVYTKMRTYDVSQIPVIDNQNIVGLIDETEVLLSVTGNPSGFNLRVGKVMTQKIEAIDVKKAATDLLPIFERARAACVMENGQFLGLVTPIDFLNYMRKRTGEA